jgi:mannitol/fructose-specific phosphotransferase system IIA component (Ntr-type)
VRLCDLLSQDEVFTDIQAKDKWEGLGQLLDLLIAANRLRLDQRKAIYDALAARERIASTGLGEGIALPHATVDGPSPMFGG